MSAQVRITRRGTDIGKNDDRRVYVTGPHFGRGVFSSTDDASDPETLFSATEAEQYLRQGKWRQTDARIEPVNG